MSNHPDRDTHPLGAQSWAQRLSTRRGIALLAGLSLALLALTALGAWYFLSTRPTGLDAMIDAPPPASLEELAEQYPELASILLNSELDSVYKEFFVVYEEGGADAALDLARQRGILTDDDELRMTLELDTTESAALVEALEANGIKVTAASGNVIDVAIPVGLIEAAIEMGDPGRLFRDIEGLEHVVRIRLPRVSLQDAGSIEIESLATISALDWQDAGYRGEGIKIGVLDMGFNGYKDLLGSELPGQVTARSFIYGTEIDDTDTTHGTACAEVIHDIAPGAELYFAAYETDAEQRQAMDWLVQQGVDIVSHSAGSIYGPMDGSGDLAIIVDRIVEGGILWVNSAGNSGDTHYRGVFTDSDGDGFHEFSPGDELMGFAPDGVSVLVLNWDDWANGTQDFELFVVDEDQNRITSSENVQDGPGDDTAEILRYYFPDSGPYYIAFYARNATRAVTFDFYIYDAILEYVSPEHSITTPADAHKSLAVGATFWRNDALEEYSSQGPTNDGRLKPEISAPTGVSSAARGRAFYGTSASAPHVSGAAALVLQAYPDFSPEDVIAFLQSRAVDLGPGGPDHQFGYGRLSLGEPPAGPGTPALPETPELPLPTVELPELPTAIVEQPTEVGILIQTSTPKRNPVETPSPSEDEEDDSSLLIVLGACVLLPGALGLGVIGLLAWVLLRRRSQQPARRPAAPPVRPPARPPAGPPVPPAYPPAAPAEPQAEVWGFCPQCNAPHRPQARFCTYCGLAFDQESRAERKAVACVHCGQALRSGSKFCPHCGKPQ